MTFGQFVTTLRENEALPEPPWRYYMQALLVWSATSKGGSYNAGAGGSFESAAGPLMYAKVGASLCADVRERLGWQWLSEALAEAECGGIHSCTLWAGHGSGATPMHFDALSNFFTQLRGSKQVLVFPPSQSYNLYPHSTSHPMDTYAQACRRPHLRPRTRCRGHAATDVPPRTCRHGHAATRGRALTRQPQQVRRGRLTEG